MLAEAGHALCRLLLRKLELLAQLVCHGTRLIRACPELLRRLLQLTLQVPGMSLRSLHLAPHLVTDSE